MNRIDEIGRMGRRDFLCRAVGASCLAGLLPANELFSAAPPGERAVAPEPLYWAWWGWEPLAHYRRAGGNVGGVNTKSPTLELWYDRLHSDALARQMADLGINLGVTHFFKGFGLVAERAEQQRTATLVKYAHGHGIKILGYCQSRSLYHEQFLLEEPRAADWIQRDEQGQLRTWSSVKYRWAPCILAREFRDYMKRAIRVGLEDVGLDGLHFDNDYAQPCYCPRCERGFREWLTARFPAPQQRFGRSSLADVRLPTLPVAPGRIDDPLVQEWVRFRCESLAGYHAELCAYARQLRPNVILLGNPAYPRGPNSPGARSVWPVQLGRQLNLLFAENGNFSGVENGMLVSQVRAYKQAAAIGYRVISTVWRRNKLNASGLPETADEVALQIAEAAANGGIPGTNWALRPGGEGDRMRIDRTELSAALASSLRFVRGNETLLAGARPVRDVAVLRTFASMAFNAPEADTQIEAAEEVLIRGGFAWASLFGEDMRPLSGFAALVLAGQSHLSDAEVGAIRAFASGGGAVILVGDNGSWDENGNKRARPAFEGLDSPGVARIAIAAPRPQAGGAERTSAPPSEAHGTSTSLPPWSKQLVDAIERTAGARLAVRLRGTDTVTVSACELPGNRLAVHLVNYAAGQTPAGLRVELGNRFQAGRTARMLAPDLPPRSLAILRNPRPTVAVSPFGVYSVLIVPGQ